MTIQFSCKVQTDLNRFIRLGEQIPQRVRDAVEATAFNVEHRAKASMKGGGTPHEPSPPGSPPARDTGTLAASIHTWVPEDAGRDNVVQAVGDGVDYGIHLEFGTENMAARPWLIPATEAEREKFKKRLEHLFDE